MDKEEAKEVYEYLKATPLFTYFEDEALMELLQDARIIRCDTEQRVIQEGEVGPEFYLVARGSVDVTVSEGDREVFISTIGEGQFFGEAGLFTRVRRTANVVASDGTVLVAIGRPFFLSFLQKRPKAGIQLLMLIIYSLLKKLRSVNQELAFERKFDIDQEDIDEIIRGILEEQ
ncbi:MAG: cyclic nucleotide-binding domain-containing protein [Spirochaetes bacterium]|nr:cyclic nucleotide-binding domain-containing protein [Spirochaetota bacterium]